MRNLPMEPSYRYNEYFTRSTANTASHPSMNFSIFEAVLSRSRIEQATHFMFFSHPILLIHSVFIYAFYTFSILHFYIHSNFINRQSIPYLFTYPFFYPSVICFCTHPMFSCALQIGLAISFFLFIQIVLFVLYVVFLCMKLSNSC